MEDAGHLGRELSLGLMFVEASYSSFASRHGGAAILSTNAEGMLYDLSSSSMA